MKKLIALTIGLALALASCMGPHGPDVVESVEDMEAGAQKTVELLLEAHVSGDRSALDQFLLENDASGELTLLVNEALAETPVPRWAAGFDPPPPLDAMVGGVPVYGDGDVLVFSGTGSLTSLLFDLVLINAYGHAGIVDRTMVETATPYTSGTPAIVSATLPEGVRYQTYEELYLGNETWTLLSVAGIVPGARLVENWGALFTAAYPTDATTYSFLHPNYTPVTKEDNYYWYCSKVPYRIWRDMSAYPPPGFVELEYTGLYELDDPDGFWTIQRSSILYQIYACWYNWLPRWLRRYARSPDQVLKDALAELVTPDELRAAFGHSAKAVWGDPTPEGFFAP